MKLDRIKRGAAALLRSDGAVPGEDPALGVVVEAQVRIVIDRGWRGEKDELALGPQSLLGEADKLTADALTLKPGVHSEIGQVTAVMEVRHGTCYPDQRCSLPTGRDEIGMLQHPS